MWVNLNLGSRDQARNYPGDLSQNVFDGQSSPYSSEYYDDDNYYNDETGEQTLRLCKPNFKFIHQLIWNFQNSELSQLLK